MPLGLYAKHEVEIIKQPSGLAEDITKTKAFELLTTDPKARLIISCECSQYIPRSYWSCVNLWQFMVSVPQIEWDGFVLLIDM
jgi:hypothetical protein